MFLKSSTESGVQGTKTGVQAETGVARTGVARTGVARTGADRPGSGAWIQAGNPAGTTPIALATSRRIGYVSAVQALCQRIDRAAIDICAIPPSLPCACCCSR
ncbi:MAG: hypothetical protein QM741_18910 [Rudaea sp.]|uniref:hypothetical protein n=1 Tax=Rudaea sp. TaxID=2136325 RepID=UPI0039E4548B